MSRDEDLKDATYLGDGLYVAPELFVSGIELFAHNGLEKTDRVFLEPTVLFKFLSHLKANGVNLEKIT